VGYDLHITRKSEWSDEGQDISLSEWKVVVGEDPSLRITGEVNAVTNSGEHISYKSEGLALWSGHPSGAEIPFDFREGQIVVKSPDGPILNKMLSLADRLQAKVQGDEGEVYTLQVTHGVPLGSPTASVQSGVPLWAVIAGAVVLLVVVLLLKRFSS
jgi:hypothetical protein